MPVPSYWRALTPDDFEDAKAALADGPDATAAFLSRNVDERAEAAARVARHPGAEPTDEGRTDA